MKIVKCRKKLIDKLTEECTENIDEVKIVNENKCVCSYTICVVLAFIALTINIGIGVLFCLFLLVFKKRGYS